ncbi:MAG TPA: HD domain-containing phosphohydrolase [Bacilli bacterium]
MLRHFYVSPALNIQAVVTVMMIGFLPSYLYRLWTNRLVSYVLVFNALLLVSAIFSLMQEWALGGVFVLVPIYALLFKDKQIYLNSALISLVVSICLGGYILYEPGNGLEQMVIMLDLFTIYVILVFLIYFVVKDLVWHSTVEAKYLQTIRTLTRSVEAKDPYTHGHSDRVALLGEAIAQIAGNLDPKKVYHSGLIHDVGKLSIPDFILLKKGSLSQEEFMLMRSHTIEGSKICKSLGISEQLIVGVLYHHERWDGQGYPEGLQGERIPLVGRILCIADSLDAMASHRAYRKALHLEHIAEEIEFGCGSQFDPFLCQIVLDHWDKISRLLHREPIDVQSKTG